MTSLRMSESVKELASALIAAQKELPALLKDKTARTEKFSYDYIGLETVMPAALDVLTKHNLGIVQTVGHDPQGGSTLTTMLMHASGEWLADTQPLLLVKADPQGQGSAVTYGRRYGLMSMIGLVAEADDDGQAASKRPSPPRRQAAPTSPPAAPGVAPASANGASSTEPQQKAIHAIVAKLTPDEKRQYDIITAIQPAARVSETGWSSGQLTKAQASALIEELQRALDAGAGA